MFSSATFKNPTTKSLACQNISGNRMTYPCCDEGTPHTAGAHAQCLPIDFTAEYTVTTTKMNTINSKKKNANNEKMEQHYGDIWSKCGSKVPVFSTCPQRSSTIGWRDTAWWEIADALDLPGKFGANSCWRANSITHHKPQTASIIPSARHSGSIVDALLLGYVVAAGTLYRSSRATQLLWVRVAALSRYKTGTFMTKK